MGNKSQYPSGTASIFSAHARQAEIKIWAYCQKCMDRTEQKLVREDARNEHYQCTNCGLTHSYAVR